ncbi:hypothetical protein FA13DRAFT_1713917 [Coprinellus micaceus]|uniref:Uncharacterized protein n=1 Tax=Coprinellus micaceus TaxID=71717 RepID=A0A4Y7SUD6_COPMI|nr:hypothetical protein FA13DRAFT_1713917 [Coprinellus micaceus]
MLDDTLFHNAWHNAARSRIPAVLDQGRKASLTLNLTQLFNCYCWERHQRTIRRIASIVPDSLFVSDTVYLPCRAQAKLTPTAIGYNKLPERPDARSIGLRAMTGSERRAFEEAFKLYHKCLVDLSKPICYHGRLNRRSDVIEVWRNGVLAESKGAFVRNFISAEVARVVSSNIKSFPSTPYKTATASTANFQRTYSLENAR